MSEKKIVFDGRFLSLSHAGIGRYSYELMKNLLPLDEKQKYALVVMRGTQFEKELAQRLYERQNPVEIIEVNYGHYSIGEQTKMLTLLRSLKPSLVHFPHFNHPILYRGKFVVTIHDLTLSQYAERGGLPRRTIYKIVIGRAARAATKIFTVSEFVKHELISEFRLPPSKILTTYNGIDKKFRKITNPRLLKRAEKYGLHKPYILSVGQWRSHKNLLRLVEAFHEISNERKWKGKIELVFTGREDSKFPQLKEQINRLGLARRVKFTGFVEDEDLPIIYNNALLFAFPSLSEGFGLPGLEAQACGTPVVSSERTCLPEVFARGALYFNPEDVSDMTQKISMVLENRKLREHLIEEGERNTKRFSWEKTARKTLEVYREILYKGVI